MKDLKNHLESQFEDWMNWNNWGIYSPNLWDDNIDDEPNEYN